MKVFTLHSAGRFEQGRTSCLRAPCTGSGRGCVSLDSRRDINLPRGPPPTFFAYLSVSVLLAHDEHGVRRYGPIPVGPLQVQRSTLIIEPIFFTWFYTRSLQLPAAFATGRRILGILEPGLLPCHVHMYAVTYVQAVCFVTCSWLWQ